MKKIVVVGAGYAGILTAKKLAKKTKKRSDVEITIIDKRPFHTMLTELHEVAAWRVEEDSIKISLDRVFAGRGVKVVLDNVTSVDYEKNEIICENSTHSYDFMVMATGSKPAFFNIPGAKENTFSLWSYEDAVSIREHIMNMFRAAAQEPKPDKKRELLTFYVVGGGFTGVEMIGELAELVPSLCDRFEIDPSFVSLNVVDMMDRVCTVLPNKLSDKVVRRLKKMRVNVLLKTSIKSVGENEIEYSDGKQTKKEKTHTVIWTAGIEGSDLAQDSEALGLTGRGRIQTDDHLRSQKHKNVYIGGDNIFYIPEGEKNPVPQMVENCEACADTIAHNIVCELTGQGTLEKYAPKFHGVMVCIGGRYGVAHVGAGKTFFGLPSFFAMFSKHFINIIYFIQVLGWNKIFSYISHEFFTIRNCRSFVGGHFSNRSPSFLLVPLRMFLGFYWLYEGIVKVGEGWLQSPKLTGFFTGASAYFDSIVGTISGETVDASAAATGETATAAATGAAEVADAVTTSSATVAEVADAVTTSSATVAEVAEAVVASTADAVASASGEVVSTGVNVIINWNFFGWVRLLLMDAGEVASKFQIALMDSFLNTFVMPYDGMQMFFQTFIVFAEILVGLALLGGLFTTAAAAFSLVLQFMFLTTTGLYMSSWWMAFASIAMLFGGGRAFSCDYYVIPFLKRKWKNLKFVKKWYLYND